jgi:TonB family protein
MHPTLLESDRSFFQSAECAFVSIVAHVAVVWIVVGATDGGIVFPTTERDARVFFLLPPDRVDTRMRQSETIRWGRLGQDLQNGKLVIPPVDGPGYREPTHSARRSGAPSGARGELPFGPVQPFVPDTAFSILEVDEMVERYDGSAAPAYPHDLLALGAQGMVHTLYVVDTTGRVDTTSIQVVESDDPRFTASVLDALGAMRFRPARRAGKTVRQLVEQSFSFRIAPPAEASKQVS